MPASSRWDLTRRSKGQRETDDVSAHYAPGIVGVIKSKKIKVRHV